MNDDVKRQCKNRARSCKSRIAESAAFKSLLLTNPNYFGNLAGPARTFRRMALAATLAAAAMLPATPAAASELLIFHVYVDGPNGGTDERSACRRARRQRRAPRLGGSSRAAALKRR